MSLHAHIETLHPQNPKHTNHVTIYGLGLEWVNSLFLVIHSPLAGQAHEGSGHILATRLQQMLILECCMVKCESKNKHQKRHVFKGDWLMCSKYVIHFRLNNQYNWLPHRGGRWENLLIIQEER